MDSTSSPTTGCRKRSTSLRSPRASWRSHSEARALDVTDRAAVTALVDDVVAAHGRLDVLVANAGVMLLSRLESLLVDQWEQMLDVDVRGLMYGVAAALPHFRRRDGGHVVTIASVGAHQVVPTCAVYSAPKYAAWAFTEGLRQESDPGIRVTTVSPGVVESELATPITDPHAADVMAGYRAAAIPADAIARAVSFALDQPADVDVDEIVVRPAAQRGAGHPGRTDLLAAGGVSACAARGRAGPAGCPASRGVPGRRPGGPPRRRRRARRRAGRRRQRRAAPAGGPGCGARSGHW